VIGSELSCVRVLSSSVTSARGVHLCSTYWYTVRRFPIEFMLKLELQTDGVDQVRGAEQVYWHLYIYKKASFDFKKFHLDSCRSLTPPTV
jgi:hypothetical protein